MPSLNKRTLEKCQLLVIFPLLLVHNIYLYSQLLLRNFYAVSHKKTMSEPNASSEFDLNVWLANLPQELPPGSQETPGNDQGKSIYPCCIYLPKTFEIFLDRT